MGCRYYDVKNSVCKRDGDKMPGHKSRVVCQNDFTKCTTFNNGYSTWNQRDSSDAKAYKKDKANNSAVTIIMLTLGAIVFCVTKFIFEWNIFGSIFSSLFIGVIGAVFIASDLKLSRNIFGIALVAWIIGMFLQDELTFGIKDFFYNDHFTLFFISLVGGTVFIAYLDKKYGN